MTHNDDSGWQPVRCIVCGGGHEPRLDICDPNGMDKEIERIGARRWNAITANVSKLHNHYPPNREPQGGGNEQ